MYHANVPPQVYVLVVIQVIPDSTCMPNGQSSPVWFRNGPVVF